jgi:peroxiredoxin
MSKKGLLASIGVTLVIALSVFGYYQNHTLQRKIATPGIRAAIIQAPEPENGIIGTTRPDFSLPDVSGKLRNIAEWDGKVIAINFWATWCPPCIKEIPEFIELQHKYQEQGLQFIGIALQRPEEVIGFMEKYGMNYPVLAGEMEVIEISETYGNDIGALPYTVIINREGHIHFVKRGPLEIARAEEIISELL